MNTIKRTILHNELKRNILKQIFLRLKTFAIGDSFKELKLQKTKKSNIKLSNIKIKVKTPYIIQPSEFYHDFITALEAYDENDFQLSCTMFLELLTKINKYYSLKKFTQLYRKFENIIARSKTDLESAKIFFIRYFLLKNISVDKIKIIEEFKDKLEEFSTKWNKPYFNMNTKIEKNKSYCVIIRKTKPLTDTNFIEKYKTDVDKISFFQSIEKDLNVLVKSNLKKTVEDKRHFLFEIVLPSKYKESSVKRMFIPNSQAYDMIKILKKYFEENPQLLYDCDEESKIRELNENEFKIHLKFEDEIAIDNIKIIKEKMKLMNLSSYMVAQLLGVGEPCISKILNKKSEASLGNVIKFAELLNIDIRYFLLSKNHGNFDTDDCSGQALSLEI